LRGRRRGIVGHDQAARRPDVPRSILPGKIPGQPPAAVVERLKTDPALRFHETGRDLLRLLNIHTIRAEDWTKIIDSVPAHRREIIARLAWDCAEVWAELAMRVEHDAQERAT
jgi:hypothetical protein